MAVTATNSTAITITPNRLRYDLRYDRVGSLTRGEMDLQRSQKLDNGLWVDAPVMPDDPGFKANVPLPASVDLRPVLNLLPAILAKLGVSDVYIDVRLWFTSNLTNGVLDVGIRVQVNTTAGWKAKSIPSLNQFCAANPDLAGVVESAWYELDAGVDAANATAKWL